MAAASREFEGTEVAVFGPDREIPSLVRQLDPERLRFYHATAGAELLVWDGDLGPRLLEEALRRTLDKTPLSLPWRSDPTQYFLRHKQLAEERDEEQHKQLAGEREASARLAKRRPAVSALFGVMVAVFVVQWVWGGPSPIAGGPALPPLVAHMGSLIPEAVSRGEWWRLLSTMFVHDTLQGLIFSGTVLLWLGSLLESYLGAPRLLLCYFASALVGNIAAWQLSTAPQSLGAPGGLAGLLGAVFVLRFHRRRLLPRRVARGLVFGGGVFTLGQGLEWAHAGGGVTGAVFLLALSPSLPTWQSGAKPSGVSLPTPPWLTAAATIASAPALAALLIAQLEGRPWLLRGAPAMARVHFPQTGFSAEVPVGLPLRFDGRVVEYSRVDLGHAVYDPLTVLITHTPAPAHPSDLDQARAWLRDERGDSWQLLEEPRLVEREGQSLVAARYQGLHDPELVRDTAVTFRHGGRWPVVVVSWKRLAVAPEQVAERVLSSLTPG